MGEFGIHICGDLADGAGMKPCSISGPECARLELAEILLTDNNIIFNK
jgi:hypothetical protein